MWGTGADTRGLFRACLRVIADDPAVAVTALAVDLVTEFDGDTAYADAVTRRRGDTDAPLAVLASMPSAIDRATAERLRDNGIAVLEGAAQRAGGARAPGRVATARRRIDADVDQARRERWLQRLADWAPEMAFDLLADYGVPVVRLASRRVAGGAVAGGVPRSATPSR